MTRASLASRCSTVALVASAACANIVGRVRVREHQLDDGHGGAGGRRPPPRPRRPTTGTMTGTGGTTTTGTGGACGTGRGPRPRPQCSGDDGLPGHGRVQDGGLRCERDVRLHRRRRRDPTPGAMQVQGDCKTNECVGGKRRWTWTDVERHAPHGAERLPDPYLHQRRGLPASRDEGIARARPSWGASRASATGPATASSATRTTSAAGRPPTASTPPARPASAARPSPRRAWRRP